MPRGRRYRTFVIFSVVFGLAFLHFIRSREWSNEWTEPTASPKIAPATVPHDSTHDSTSHHNHDTAAEIKFDSKPRIEVPTVPKEHPSDIKKPSTQETTKQKELLDGDKSKPETIQKPPTRPAADDSKSIDAPSVKPGPKSSDDKSQNANNIKPVYDVEDQLDDVIDSIPTKHWKKLPENFPILESHLITLPSGQPRKLPKLQVVTQEESSAQTTLRKQRLAAIKEEFEHAWSGYSKYAMGHDEVRPVSGSYRDPFAGWGATLVDALDTLWIMEMKDEFADALEQVRNIDFTTSSIRNDIPLFETVIRYLGGLIGAYDISGQKYPVLLDKAVELAEILMGAFDTPNRMPVTYYKWAPESVAQPHRAGTRVVLAELGSLSVEFTRLAQMTQEPKYYDAIARITNELEIMQNNTRLPGMWPLAIDASGCKINTTKLSGLPSLGQNSDVKVYEDRGLGTPTPTPTPNHTPKQIPKDVPMPKDFPFPKDVPIPKDLEKREGGLEVDAEPAVYEPEMKTTPTVQLVSFPNKDCENQGLASPHGAKSDRFGLGGQSDSTYEYLPKEYMLLGGLNDQYRSMYEISMEPVREKLLFRPMLPEQEDIRFVATVQVSESIHKDEEELTMRYTYEGTHLTCFAGGMFAVGAKLFGIDEDMEIAAKLTEGCVWAYGSTNTGIMPEGFELLACDDPLSCPWNETRYLDVMDPNEKSRIQQAEAWYERELQNAKQAQEVSLEKKPNIVAPKRISESGKSDTTGENPYAGIVKREASNSGIDDYDEHAHLSATKTSVGTQENPKARVDTKVQNDGIPAKPTVLSHKEYVANRLEVDHIPLGYTKIQSRKYILRPEAIESVFIMYRLTGDDTWREKGWKMFQSIARYCRTELADSAISDVTSPAPELLDEMESFWLAETLKYFYLLFSDPSVVSLDEYVLNTEAHPFKRPES